MQDVHLRIWPGPSHPIWIGFICVIMVLAVLGGCATQEPAKSAPVVAKITEKESSATLVVRLADGRQGFAIKETTQLNDSSRRDFESAVTAIDAADYDKAIELLKAIIEQSPDVTAPLINLGIAYQRFDKPDQAEAQFKAALQLVAGHPVASNQYGLLLRKKGQFSEARKIYEEALVLFPEYYPLHRNLGILCDLYLGDLESALSHYQAYSQAVPEDARAKLWIADLSARMGK